MSEEANDQDSVRESLQSAPEADEQGEDNHLRIAEHGEEDGEGGRDGLDL